MPESPRRRAVLLDRDGTINIEREYISDPDLVELLPNAAAGLRRLRDAGWLLVVISNQAGVGRGLFTREDVEAVNQRLRELLLTEGLVLDGLYYCPHHPDDQCLCRKPRPGMIQQAARDLGFAPAQAVMIGDRPSDLEVGRAVGARTILVRTGYGAACEGQREAACDHVANDLLDAAEFILRKD